MQVCVGACTNGARTNGARDLVVADVWWCGVGSMRAAMPSVLPAEDDECISRDYVDGFHLPTPGEKGGRHMDIVRRMDALATCIEPLTKVRGWCGVGWALRMHHLLSALVSRGVRAARQLLSIHTPPLARLAVQARLRCAVHGGPPEVFGTVLQGPGGRDSAGTGAMPHLPRASSHWFPRLMPSSPSDCVCLYGCPVR
jgi:hypothetical protein